MGVGAISSGTNVEERDRDRVKVIELELEVDMSGVVTEGVDTAVEAVDVGRGFEAAAAVNEGNQPPLELGRFADAGEATTYCSEMR